MKQPAFYLTLLLLSTAALAQSQEGELGVTLDVTYVSRYIDKGFDIYRENHSGIQPSLDLDLYGTGFGVKLGWFRANSSGFENDEMLDYTVYYYNSLFEGKNYAMDYQISWIYHSFPDNPKKISNTQEIEAGFSWPDVCPCGIVPSYTVSCEWPAGRNYENRNAGGWAHTFGLSYDLAVPSLASKRTEQVLHLSADLVYNDGLGGEAVDHDWSHMVFGVSTGFDLAENITLTPALYYQASMDNSVNTQDEFWVGLSMTYKF